MKITGFILFFLIVFSFYFLVNFYLARRGWAAFHDLGWPRSVFLLVFLLLALLYPLSRFLERSSLRDLAIPMTQIGAYYLAMMIFLLVLLLAVDGVRLLDWLFRLSPQGWRSWKGPLARWVYLGCLLVALLLTLVGAWNARHIQVRRLALSLPKKQGALNQVRLVLASDIHLGTLIPASRFREMARLINEQKPDAVLIGGDLFDEDVTRLNESELVESLASLKSRYGTYAILGNHEYFAGAQATIALMRKGGFTVLREESVRVADAFYLVGRDDRQGSHWGGLRTPQSRLMANLPKDLAVMAMDHQPFSLEEAADAGVDLQLSGHTHHGQIWPFNFITNRVYEISWGYGRKGQTQYYVSCGAGTWGPPVRLGNRPEIVVLEISFI